jgi:DNA-binding transcriptional MerR regulator
MTPARRARWLLLAGAALGIALAVVGLLAPDAPSIAPDGDEIARVNGVPIARRDFARALARVEADVAGPPSDAERQHVLERLIDDELLVQRGVALGLIESDAVVRKALASAVIASVVADASSAVPGDAELEAFYTANAAYFARPGRARIARIRVRDGPEADARLRAALAALDSGVPLAEVRARIGGDDAESLPDAPLPEAKLRELLGPTQSGVALALEPGTHSGIQTGEGGRFILVSLERESERTPALDEIRPQVQAEWTRRAGERALETYLAELRGDALISRADATSP